MRVVRRRSGWALGLTLTVAIVAPAIGAHAQPAEPSAESGGPIPLAEVAARAAEIRSLLETQDAAITPSREIQAILERLPALATELRARLDETGARLDANPPLPVIEQLGSVWEATRARLRGWSDTVTQWTSRVEQERARLASLRESWLRSREAAAAAGAPKVVLDQIDGVLGGLNAARTRLEARLSALLATQYRLAVLQRRCDEGLARVAQVKADRIRRLGERDGPSLWSAVLWTGALEPGARGGSRRARGRAGGGRRGGPGARDPDPAARALLPDPGRGALARPPRGAPLGRGRSERGLGGRGLEPSDLLGPGAGLLRRALDVPRGDAAAGARGHPGGDRPGDAPHPALARPRADRRALRLRGALPRGRDPLGALDRAPLRAHAVPRRDGCREPRHDPGAERGARARARLRHRRDGGGGPPARRAAAPRRVLGRLRAGRGRLRRARAADRGRRPRQQLLRPGHPGRGAGGPGPRAACCCAAASSRS